MATGFGLKAVRSKTDGEVRLHPYVIPASDGTIYGLGEVVMLAGAIDADTQLPTVIIADDEAAVLVGAIQGFQPDPTQPYTGDYRPASTRRIALVAHGSDTIFQAQEDAAGGSISAANVASGINAPVEILTATAATRLSQSMVDSSGATASSAQLKVLGVCRDVQFETKTFRLEWLFPLRPLGHAG